MDFDGQFWSDILFPFHERLDERVDIDQLILGNFFSGYFVFCCCRECFIFENGRTAKNGRICIESLFIGETIKERKIKRKL